MGLKVSVNDAIVNYGQGVDVEAVFAVTLSEPSQSPVTVDVATLDFPIATPSTGHANVDYVPASASLTFAPGETSLPFKVVAKGINGLSIDKVFEVELSNSSVEIRRKVGMGILHFTLPRRAKIAS